MPASLKAAPTRVVFILFSVLSAAVALPSPVLAAKGQKEFSRTSLDIGLVVRDLGVSMEFYTKAIGLREAKGFTMPGALAENFSFTAGEPLEVRVLALGEKRTASKLKLIALPREQTPRENERADSQRGRGLRYLTLFVANMDRTLERLKEAGVKPLGDGPIQLGDDSRHRVSIVLVRDPDGNLVELVGPAGSDSH